MPWSKAQADYARQLFQAQGVAVPDSFTPAQVEYFAQRYGQGQPSAPQAPPVQPQAAPVQGQPSASALRGQHPAVAQHDDFGMLDAFKMGLRESPTGLILKGLPEENDIDLSFWEEVAKGIGSFSDPVSLALFFAGGGLGGAAAKKLGVEGIKRLVVKKGLTQALKSGAALGLHGTGAELTAQMATGEGYDPLKLAEAGGKAAFTGAALGPAAMLPSPLARLAGEIGTFAVVPPLLEGRRPTSSDVAHSAATIGVLRGVQAAPGLLKGKGRVDLPESISQADLKKAKGKKYDSLDEAIVDPVPAKQHKLSGTKDFYTKWIDDLNPLKKAIDRWEKGAQAKLLPKYHPYILARNTRGAIGEATSKIEQGIAPHLKDLSKEEYHDFRKYYLAKRILSRPDKYTPEVLKEIGQGKGIDMADVRRTVKNGDAVWADKAEALNQYSRDLIKDVYGEKTADIILDPNDFYAPGFRDFGPEIEAKLGRYYKMPGADPVHKLKAESSRPFIDPVEGLVRNTYNLIRYKRSNNVLHSLVDMAELNGDLSIARELPPGAKAAKNTIRLKRDDKAGEPVDKTYKIDKDVYDALQAVNREELNALLRFGGGPARLLRAGATMTPEFGLRNIFRDVFSAYIYSKNGFLPQDFLRGVGQILTKGEYYREYLESGAAHSAWTSLDRPTLQRNIAEFIAKSPADVAKRVVRHPIDTARLLNEIGESATRIGEFRKARKKGKPPEQAAFEARDITLDFARMGPYSRQANSIVAFFNAHVQGLDKLGRELKNNPAKTSLKAMATITLPSIGLMMMNRQDPRWKDIPDWQKNFFWIIFTDDHVWRIPKPFDLGMLFGSMPERFIEWAVDNDPSQGDAIMQMVKGTVPEMVPTALNPLIEVYANKSRFTGGRIVPSYIEEDKPRALQYTPWTSRTMRELGETLGYSGAKMEHLWKGYTAGLGRYVLDASDYTLDKLVPEDKPVEPSGTYADIPVMRAFAVRYPSYSGAKIQRFYDLAEDVERLYRGRKDINLGRMRSEIVRRHGVIANANKRLKVLRNQVTRIEENKIMSGDEKRKKIDDLYMKMSAIASEAVNKLEKP